MRRWSGKEKKLRYLKEKRVLFVLPTTSNTDWPETDQSAGPIGTNVYFLQIIRNVATNLSLTMSLHLFC